jgi:hypothetical protein
MEFLGASNDDEIELAPSSDKMRKDSTNQKKNQVT